MIITKERKDFIVFMAECLIGTVIGLVLYRIYPVIGAWCLFSIILVLSPDRKDAMTLAINRIKANLIGASIGLAISYFHPVSLITMCIGIAVAMAICEWFHLKAVTKTAIVAILIITMHAPGEYFWNIALERAFGVMLGCVIGVIITYFFHIARVHSTRTIQKIRGRFHSTR